MTTIEMRNGRAYGYGKVDEKDVKNLFILAGEALYGKCPETEGNGFTDEDWEEAMLSVRTTNNLNRQAILEQRRAKREARLRRAAARRMLLRMLISTAVVILIIGGVFLATWNWYVSAPVFLIALLLEIFVLGGGTAVG